MVNQLAAVGCTWFAKGFQSNHID